MNLLTTTVEALKQTLRRPAPAHRGDQPRHPALAPYTTPLEIVTALGADSKLSVSVKDALVAALLSENQRTPTAVLQATLVVAFAPMLVRLRRKLGSRGDEDLNQSVLLAFLESTAAVRPAAYAPLALRWATEARVFAARRRERQAPRLVALDEERHAPVIAACAPSKLEAEALLDMVLAKGGRELYEAVLATEVHGEALTDHVTRTHPHCSASERESHYLRLKRARAEVLEEARRRFSRSSRLPSVREAA